MHCVIPKAAHSSTMPSNTKQCSAKHWAAIDRHYRPTAASLPTPDGRQNPTTSFKYHPPCL